MTSGNSWASVLKSTPKTISNNRCNTNDSNITYKKQKSDSGECHKLPYSYVLWSHDANCSDWSINSYKKLCTINNVSQFWKLFNNFDKLGININNFFIMKEGILPMWEDENNKNGGICSFKADSSNILRLWEYIACMLVNNMLTVDNYDINGISLNSKNNWGLIKIWNRDSNNDLTKTLSNNVLTHCKKYSMKYKSNSN